MKKNKELLDIISNIRDEHIESAKPRNIIYHKKSWAAIPAAAAVLALAVGLPYFLLNVQEKNNNSVPDNSPPNIAVTDTAETTAVSETESSCDTDSQLINNVLWTRIPLSGNPITAYCLRSENENEIFFNVLQEYTDTAFIGIRYNNDNYFTDQEIRGSIMNSSSLAADATEDFIIVYYNGMLLSQNKYTMEVYRNNTGIQFFSDMNLGGYTKFFGVRDNFIYIMNEFDDEKYVYKITPELFLYDTFEGDDAAEIEKSFDDYISPDENISYDSDTEMWTVPFSGGIMYACQYLRPYQNSYIDQYLIDDENQLSLEHTSEPMDFSLTRQYGMYMTVEFMKDSVRYNQTVWLSDENRSDYSFSYDERYIYVSEGDESDSDINIHVFSYEAVPPDRPDCSGSLVINREKEMEISIPDGYRIREFVSSASGDGTLYCELIQKDSVMISDPAVSSTAPRAGIINPEGIYTDITEFFPEDLESVLSCTLETGTGALNVNSGPVPQRDGTYLWVSNHCLYSFNTADKSISTIAELPENYEIPLGNIYKLNDSQYITPSFVLLSDFNNIQNKPLDTVTHYLITTD